VTKQRTGEAHEEKAEEMRKMLKTRCAHFDVRADKSGGGSFFLFVQLFGYYSHTLCLARSMCVWCSWLFLMLFLFGYRAQPALSV